MRDSSKVTRGRFGGRISQRPELAHSDLNEWAEFQVRAHDAQGHGDKVSTTIPRHLHRLMAEIVSERLIPPWRTEGDFLRYAIKHLIETLSEKKGSPTLRQSFTLYNDYEKAKNRRIEEEMKRAYVRDLEADVVRHIKAREWILAEHRIRDAEMAIPNITDDYWRKKLEEKVTEVKAYVKVKAARQRKEMGI